MADSVLARIVAYCRGFEAMGRRTFSRKLEYGIDALKTGYDREASMRLLAAAEEAQGRFGAGHPTVAAILLIAADACIRLGRPVEAEAQLRRAASILEGVKGMENVLAYSFACLSVLYRNQNLLGEAQRYLARAQLVLAPRTNEG